jgi:catechol 2,3-dioxygenase-like lactoylglutathione lyase family enzyme
MITGIDHIGLEVKDFEATVRNYEMIFGVTPNWRGGTSAWQHAWFQFGNMALDVVAAEGDGPGANAIRAEMDKFGERIFGLGFSVPDREEAVRLFERRGLQFTPPQETLSQDADGRERRWNINMMKRSSGNGVALFVVENKPDAARCLPRRRSSATRRCTRWIISWCRRPMPSAPSRCMAGGWGSISGWIAPMSNGARGSCFSAPAARSWRSARA